MTFLRKNILRLVALLIATSGLQASSTQAALGNRRMAPQNPFRPRRSFSRPMQHPQQAQNPQYNNAANIPRPTPRPQQQPNISQVSLPAPTEQQMTTQVMPQTTEQNAAFSSAPEMAIAQSAPEVTQDPYAGTGGPLVAENKPLIKRSFAAYTPEQTQYVQNLIDAQSNQETEEQAPVVEQQQIAQPIDPSVQTYPAPVEEQPMVAPTFAPAVEQQQPVEQTFAPQTFAPVEEQQPVAPTFAPAVIQEQPVEQTVAPQTFAPVVEQQPVQMQVPVVQETVQQPTTITPDFTPREVGSQPMVDQTVVPTVVNEAPVAFQPAVQPEVQPVVQPVAFQPAVQPVVQSEAATIPAPTVAETTTSFTPAVITETQAPMLQTFAAIPAPVVTPNTPAQAVANIMNNPDLNERLRGLYSLMQQALGKEFDEETNVAFATALVTIFNDASRTQTYLSQILPAAASTALLNDDQKAYVRSNMLNAPGLAPQVAQAAASSGLIPQEEVPTVGGVIVDVPTEAIPAPETPVQLPKVSQEKIKKSREKKAKKGKSKKQGATDTTIDATTEQAVDQTGMEATTTTSGKKDRTKKAGKTAKAGKEAKTPKVKAPKGTKPAKEGKTPKVKAPKGAKAAKEGKTPKEGKVAKTPKVKTPKDKSQKAGKPARAGKKQAAPVEATTDATGETMQTMVVEPDLAITQEVAPEAQAQTGRKAGKVAKVKPARTGKKDKSSTEPKAPKKVKKAKNAITTLPVE